MDKEPPEKYIRTFADDMEAVQRGNAPDPASPKPIVTAPVPPVTPTPKPAATASAPPPVAAPVPAPPQNPPLQTYSNDFRERMKETRASTATILAAEQDSLPRPAHIGARKPSHIGLPYIIAGVVLLIASTAGAYVAYRYYTKTTEPVASAPAIPTPIFVDEREEISGTGPALLQAITASVQRPLSAGAIRLLYAANTDSTQTTSSVTIFSALPLSAPDILLRNVNASGSMVGVVNISGFQSPFFILSVSSYSNAFSGMLLWEPLMPIYLAELFPSSALSSGEQTASSTAATTTVVANSTSSLQSTATPAPFAVTFVDATVVNHDVRVYRDASGRDVLVYGFWNQATLVIARDAAAFTEILGRLATFRAP
ncbi:hypothetical protein HY415_02025 [Candidatus Kaiserbacteria bacterium]|nr:hypothetical protein [Candidatus Kaiserbacteria bacterium]